MASAKEEIAVCPVCHDSVDIFAVGQCDHPICYKCSTRMRILCDQMYCAICRSDLPKVLFIRNLEKFDRVNTSAFIIYRGSRIFFDSEATEAAYECLLEMKCNLCKKDNGDKLTFQTFRLLSNHMRTVHQLFGCELCNTHLKLLSRDRKFYNRHDLGEHKRIGDRDDTSYKGHPLCQFCDERYLDNDALILHLRKDHYFCHFCEASGISNEFFWDYENLKQHFSSSHYLCEEGDCANVEFTNAFRSDIDLKAHVATIHSQGVGKSAARQMRMIDIDVNLTQREGGGGARGGGRDGGRGPPRGSYYNNRQPRNAGNDRVRDEREDQRRHDPRREQREKQRMEIEVAQAISASLAEVQRQGHVSVIDPALARNSLQLNSDNNAPSASSFAPSFERGTSRDFPSLDGRSPASSGGVPSSNSGVDVGPDSLANKVAYRTNNNVGGSLSERDFPTLLGNAAGPPVSCIRKVPLRKPVKTVWKIDVMQPTSNANIATSRNRAVANRSPKVDDFPNLKRPQTADVRANPANTTSNVKAPLKPSAAILSNCKEAFMDADWPSVNGVAPVVAASVKVSNSVDNAPATACSWITTVTNSKTNCRPDSVQKENLFKHKNSGKTESRHDFHDVNSAPEKKDDIPLVVGSKKTLSEVANMLSSVSVTSVVSMQAVETSPASHDKGRRSNVEKDVKVGAFVDSPKSKKKRAAASSVGNEKNAIKVDLGAKCGPSPSNVTPDGQKTDAFKKEHAPKDDAKQVNTEKECTLSVSDNQQSIADADDTHRKKSKKATGATDSVLQESNKKHTTDLKTKKSIVNHTEAKESFEKVMDEPRIKVGSEESKERRKDKKKSVIKPSERQSPTRKPLLEKEVPSVSFENAITTKASVQVLTGVKGEDPIENDGMKLAVNPIQPIVAFSANDFPSLLPATAQQPTVRSASIPPGFSAVSSNSISLTKPPPGFDMPAPVQGNLSKAPPGFEGKILSFEGFKNTEPVYIPPLNSSERNKQLINHIQSRLSEGQFGMFKFRSAEFRKGSISASEYYTDCCNLFGGADGLKDIMPELLALLPDIGKQKKLLDMYRAQSGSTRIAGTTRGCKPWGKETFLNEVWSDDLTSCTHCTQVLTSSDLSQHQALHGFDSDFPSLCDYRTIGGQSVNRPTHQIDTR